MTKFALSLILSLAFHALSAAERVSLTVSNPTGKARVEIVEADVSLILKRLGGGDAENLSDAAAHIVVTDADGREIASQVTHDGKLVFLAGVGARSKSVYYAKRGEPGEYEPRAKGRLFTERQDEFGWENDRVAYRIYGHGGAVGYDLFNKNTPELMLDWWYASEQNAEMRSVADQLRQRGYRDLADQLYNAFSYHVDHGKGMDCYTVGSTLGGGASALLRTDGTLLMPRCYASFEVLDNGPLRFCARLTYPAQEYEGRMVTETRVITLDAGSHFNRAEVRYEGLDKPAEMVTGTVVHKSNPVAYVLSSANGYMGYEDLGDASVYQPAHRNELAKRMGKIYIGLVYPDTPERMAFIPMDEGAAAGHIAATVTYTPGTSYTYYFGSGWSRNASTGFQSLAEWEAFLFDQTEAVRNPLRVRVK